MRALAFLLLAAIPAPAAQEEEIDLKTVLRDPAALFPAFQKLVARGEYGRAHKFVAGVTYEEFYAGVASFEAPRRLIATTRQHGVSPEPLRVRLCSPEFGMTREFRLRKLRDIHQLDLGGEIDYLRDRALSWFRHQKKRADGWHFAYAPDWEYAPLARTCVCGK